MIKYILLFKFIHYYYFIIIIYYI